MGFSKKILVPTDFSRAADYAVVYAANLAHFTGAEIILYHTFLPFESGFYPETQSDQENLALEQQLRFRLSHMQDLLKKSHQKLKISAFVDRGAFTPTVKNYCKKNDIGLIVMGTKGASGLREKMLGSYTADLIQDAPCPVIAIPAKWQFRKPQKFALAVTYKTQDLHALQTLLSLNKYFSAGLSIMHVHHPDEADADSANPITQNDFASIADGRPLKFKTIRSEDVLDALLNTALQDETDVLAISPGKREKAWEQLLTRSLSKSAVCHIQIPIMAIPPAPAAGHQNQKQQQEPNQ